MKLGFKNNRQNIIASEIVEGLEGLDWLDAPIDFDQFTQAAIIVDNELQIITLAQFETENKQKELAIQDVFSRSLSEEEILKTDITIIGLHIEPWQFTRGFKTRRNYHIGNATGKIACYVEYTYTFTNGVREIKTINRHIHYLNNLGEVVLSQEIHAPTDRKTIKSINRDIRQGRLDYLVAGAEQLDHDANNLEQIVLGMQAQENPDQNTINYYTDVISQYRSIHVSLEDILHHYKDAMGDYITINSMDWENGVLNETDPDILADLDKTARLPDALFPYGLTAGQSMIHQLNGTEPTE